MIIPAATRIAGNWLGIGLFVGGLCLSVTGVGAALGPPNYGRRRQPGVQERLVMAAERRTAVVITRARVITSG